MSDHVVVLAICAAVGLIEVLHFWLYRRNARPIEHNMITGRGGMDDETYQ
ncbi:hypothetical protein SEA_BRUTONGASTER_78 [Gordonia phage BrutonGaster]|uniref:Uncharacterized protein n=1 Tax=Gordonia phage BrutonGaster TaxID=2530116 RepID=A0A482JKZ0_9CAUD|nr:hypothetical protein HOV26_gp104 [Gordonia phage BrutonGaster]QBP33386.1 hypothetical protein SEA_BRUTONGASTER_78 [Gordonia phage BrutonGaster]